MCRIQLHQTNTDRLRSSHQSSPCCQVYETDLVRQVSAILLQTSWNVVTVDLVQNMQKSFCRLVLSCYQMQTSKETKKCNRMITWTISCITVLVILYCDIDIFNIYQYRYASYIVHFLKKKCVIDKTTRQSRNIFFVYLFLVKSVSLLFLWSLFLIHFSIS